MTVSEMAHLRIGLIGFGSWAQTSYVPALMAEESVEILALAARTNQTHTDARESLGTEFDSYTNYDDLLVREDIDAVVIGVPPDASATVALASVRAGKHIFVEPPLEESPTTDELLGRATGTDRVFHADLEARYLPTVDAIKDLAERDDFGVLRTIRIHLGNDWATHWSQDDARQASRVVDLSTWYIDLMDSLIGHLPETAGIVGADQQVGHATLSYPCGADGNWHFDLRTGSELSLRMTIDGEYGEIEADLLTGDYRWRINADSGSGSAPCSQPVLGFVGMRESVDAFLSAVRGESQTRSDAAVYSRVHTTTTALRRSQAESVVVSVVV